MLTFWSQLCYLEKGLYGWQLLKHFSSNIVCHRPSAFSTFYLSPHTLHKVFQVVLQSLPSISVLVATLLLSSPFTLTAFSYIFRLLWVHFCRQTEPDIKSPQIKSPVSTLLKHPLQLGRTYSLSKDSVIKTAPFKIPPFTAIKYPSNHMISLSASSGQKNVWLKTSLATKKYYYSFSWSPTACVHKSRLPLTLFHDTAIVFQLPGAFRVSFSLAVLFLSLLTIVPLTFISTNIFSSSSYDTVSGTKIFRLASQPLANKSRPVQVTANYELWRLWSIISGIAFWNFLNLSQSLQLKYLNFICLC